MSWIIVHGCRYETILNVYKPERDFVFPSHIDYGKQRRFSYDWLENNSPWLVYSKALDGRFCLPCVLFARLRSGRGGQELGVLVIRPLKTFNKAAEVLRKHASQTDYHKHAMMDMQSFMARMEQRLPSVYDMVHSARAELI